MDGTIVRKEIGSEFWDVPLSEEKQIVFPDGVKWFVSGTSALHFILDDVMAATNVKSAAIPSWCCECMITPFLQRGIRVFFYSVSVNEDHLLECDYTTVPACDISLVISYFGYSCQTAKGIPSGIVIRDMTHSLFCKTKQDADYYFGSLRKWAGFWTGGYAWKSGSWEEHEVFPAVDPDYVALRKGAMERKLFYLRGGNDDKSFLNDFGRAEEYLDRCGVMRGDDRDETAAEFLDADFIRETRIRNARQILAELKKYALFKEVSRSDCPLFVPILLKTDLRDGLKRFLIENDVYCPVHWELTGNHRITGRQKALYENELSLVCDQRYGDAEMARIIDLVKRFLKREG